MKFFEGLRGWRTVIANFLMALPIAWDVIWILLQTPEFKAVIPAEWLPFYSLGMVVVNLWLRKVTITPMGKRE